MKHKLKEAFNQIRAEEALKNKTKSYIYQKTNGYVPKRTASYRFLVSAAACLLFFLLGGHWLYFTPTAGISIDINPSIELGINRFDQVISIDGYNNDGKELAALLHIKYTDYRKAINQILENETVSSLLENDGVMTIAVTGSNSIQTEQILSDMKTCTREHKNTYCYSTHAEEAEKAHEMGLSCGRYQSYLELQALYPDITPEQVQDMSMKEIRDLLSSVSDESSAETSTESPTQQEGHGAHHAYRNSQNHS